MCIIFIIIDNTLFLHSWNNFIITAPRVCEFLVTVPLNNGEAKYHDEISVSNKVSTV